MTPLSCDCPVLLPCTGGRPETGSAGGWGASISQASHQQMSCQEMDVGGLCVVKVPSNPGVCVLRLHRLLFIARLMLRESGVGSFLNPTGFSALPSCPWWWPLPSTRNVAWLRAPPWWPDCPPLFVVSLAWRLSVNSDSRDAAPGDPQVPELSRGL